MVLHCWRYSEIDLGTSFGINMYLHSQQNEGTVPHPFFLKFLDEHQIFRGRILTPVYTTV